MKRDIVFTASDPRAHSAHGTGSRKAAENGDCEEMATLGPKSCHRIKYYFSDFNLLWDKV